MAEVMHPLPHRAADWQPRCETARGLLAPGLRTGVPQVAPGARIRADGAGSPPGVDLSQFKNWSAESQQRAMDLIRAREANPWRPFYCPNTTCDGKPHNTGDGWDFNHARNEQRPPSFAEDWLTWLLNGGRGGGKTRAGAELVHKVTKLTPRIALISPTGPDLRDTMVEGVSGILATAPPEQIPLWEPSKKRLTFPNGAIATGYSGEEPDRLRGPQQGFAWIDEPAHMPLIEGVWDNLLFGLRLGRAPRICATTTPKPTKWMKALIADPMTRVSRFSTHANLDNLSDTFKRTIVDRYEGTRLGRQELHGEVLEDVEGALWQIDMIRYVDEEKLPQLDRIVVSIDPAGSCNTDSDETGIVILGISAKMIYVLADRTGKYTPSGWATTAVRAYHEFSADCIVAERNYGGDMVRSVLKSNGAEDIRIHDVNSRRGKALRAEPIVALYEKERVFHVRGAVGTLEDEQVSWIPGVGASPNRVDALVHGATELGKIVMPSEIASPNSLRRVSAAPARGMYALG